MKRCATLLPALAAAACHPAPAVTADNATANQVAAKVAAAGGTTRLSPGHYAMTFAMTRVELASPQRTGDQIKRTRTNAVCVTPDRADRPAESLFTGQANANCTFDHFAMIGGAIDARTTCREGPVTLTSTMKETFSTDGFHVDVTTNSNGAPGQAPARVTATIDGRRTGACTGKEG